ncbi:MAG TPA: hypothetical protein VF006_26035 [Longimicrobium sp.]
MSDRLFELLPAVYRDRDAAQGGPLRALLRLVGGQADLMRDDVARLYENWFIETCEDWAVPYIGELVGYTPAAEAAAAADAGSRALGRALTPRRDVANALRARRRRGTLALLERLAQDVAQWPGHAVETRRRLWTTANLRGADPSSPRTASVRDAGMLARTGGPYDALPRLPDVRRIGAPAPAGRPNVPGIALWVWPLRTYSLTRSPAYCAEEVAKHAFTFSALGNDVPLFSPSAPGRSVPEEGPDPGPITRRELDRRPGDFYGEGKAFVIYTGPRRTPVPLEDIVSTDLTGWRYQPPAGKVAVDPELGRIHFPRLAAPRGGVWVSWHHGFSADVGGGEYAVRRPVFVPVADDKPVPLYRVGRHGRFRRLRDALAAWRKEHPPRAAIEITDSGVYTDSVRIRLDEGQALQIRAASGARPVIRLLDLSNNRSDALRVRGARNTALVLDGLVITGRPVHAEGELSCLVLRHCTLVPGWALGSDGEPQRPAEPSLEIFSARACVTVEHSILGSVQVVLDEVAEDPVPIRVRDSIVDATSSDREAIGAPGCPVAHVALSIERSTVFGRVQVHAIQHAEDSIFTGQVKVARRQVGCMRFCYAPPESRTPRRYACQPDGVDAAAREAEPPGPVRDALVHRERQRVRPRFGSVRYGSPRYARLTEDCAKEIVRGASDTSEMGVFHDLFQPQRAANLNARLQQFTPAGHDAGIVYAS